MYIYILYEVTSCNLVSKQRSLLYYKVTNCHLVYIEQFVPFTGRAILINELLMLLKEVVCGRRSRPLRGNGRLRLLSQQAAPFRRKRAPQNKMQPLNHVVVVGCILNLVTFNRFNTHLGTAEITHCIITFCIRIVIR